MDVMLTYRGRTVTEADVVFIRELITAHPTASRRRLSEKLCQVWNWLQPNGTPRAMICRGLMLALHRAGHIELPPQRRCPSNPLARRPRPSPDPLGQIDRSPLCVSLDALRPLVFRQVRRTEAEPLFNSLLEHYHELGYTQPVGEQLKYLVYSQDLSACDAPAGRPIACLAWSSAPRHLGCRDRFIGWSSEARRRNIRFIAYNLRYLIPPWVQVPHLASHILGRMARLVPEDWQRIYGHPVWFLETFVNPLRHRGTCYRAANWIVLGRTTGRGKNDQTRRPNRPIKEVLGYPLCRDFRSLLAEGP